MRALSGAQNRPRWKVKVLRCPENFVSFRPDFLQGASIIFMYLKNNRNTVYMQDDSYRLLRRSNTYTVDP
jgi:hypothetical protein